MFRLLDKKVGVPALILALLICFTRLHVGVHYPTDILCGALLGTAFAFLMFFIYKKAAKSLDLPPSNEIYVSRVALAIPVTFLLTVAVLLTLSLLIR